MIYRILITILPIIALALMGGWIGKLKHENNILEDRLRASEVEKREYLALCAKNAHTTHKVKNALEASRQGVGVDSFKSIVNELFKNEIKE